MNARSCAAILAGLVWLAPPPLLAQDGGAPPEPRWRFGGAFVTAEPVGEFSRSIDTSFGASVVGHYNLTRVLRIRVDGGFVQYGSETHGICLPTCRIQLDVNTRNSIAFGGIGPELVVPTPWIRPYVNVGIGGSYFFTDSHLEGADYSEIGRTTNFDAGTFAVTAGGGVYIPLAAGRSNVAIDAGVRYHRNGTARYLREGDIRDNPDGTISFTPTRGEANLLTFLLGVSFGFGR